jgi:hypothetical protein
MKHYQIALTITVTAESEQEARDEVGMFLSAALTGEPGPIEDYSIEELMEEYDITEESLRRGDEANERRLREVLEGKL